jgi:hypothetical protein
MIEKYFIKSLLLLLSFFFLHIVFNCHTGRLINWHIISTFTFDISLEYLLQYPYPEGCPIEPSKYGQPSPFLF